MTAATGFLSLPKLAGCEQLRQLVHAYGGNKKTAKRLRISSELLDLWLTGEIDPPYHFLVAVWFASPYGFQQAFSESHWAHQQNELLKLQARSQNAELRTTLRRIATAIADTHPQLASYVLIAAADELAHDAVPALTKRGLAQSKGNALPALQARPPPPPLAPPLARPKQKRWHPDDPPKPGYARARHLTASTDQPPRTQDRSE